MKYTPALTSETFLSVSHKPKKQKEASTSIRAVLRSRRKDKQGVYVRVTIDRQHDHYPTTYYVYPSEFDALSGTVKGKDSNKEVINSHIRFLTKELPHVPLVINFIPHSIHSKYVILILHPIQQAILLYWEIS